MKKRFASLLLAVVMLMGVAAVDASADEVLTASDEAIRILKAEEGFSSKPYWDYAQWTVGYGTKCPDDKLDYYKENGISEAEAEELLRTYVARFESELYKFMNKNGTQLNQNQFDALLLFSYNCGSGWSYDTSGGLYNAVVSGVTGNTLIDAFSRWCNAGGQIKTFLLRRRLSEANMYLNGVYSQTPPENFGYVMYDACGGTARPNIQGYDTNLTAKINPTPTYPGYTFDGWYTERVGGTKVTVLDASVKNSRLYAHWLDGEGKDPAQDTANGVQVTVTANDVNVRSGPGTNYTVVSSANTGDQLVITETATGSGYTWGKFHGGWICLKYTNYDTVTAPEEEETTPVSRMGTVKVNDSLRVRSGPSTSTSVVGYLSPNERVTITEKTTSGSMTWGKISSGWISLDYVVLDTQSGGDIGTQKLTGTVKVNDFLRIRTGPGTSYAIAGYLSPNAKVEITERKSVGSTEWGKISKGWISMDYVVLDGQSSTAPAKVIKTVTADCLRVRSAAGTSNTIVGYLYAGTKVEILDTTTVGGTQWGKTSKGWISMDYVK